MKRVAIIGAGMAGLTLANAIKNCAEVEVFEKSRSAGGRMATRRIDGFNFDHGAQFFTARSREFQEFLVDHIESGLVQPWQPRVLTFTEGKKPYRRDWFEPHYVAQPGMTALCKAMSQGLELHCNTRITGLHEEEAGWLLELEHGASAGHFDWVISTAPPAQSNTLLPAQFEYQAVLAEINLEPCIALLLGSAELLPFNFDAARFRDSILNWAWLMQSKPGRPDCQALVLHATPQWSARHYEADDEFISAALLQELARLTAKVLDPGVIEQVKRWRYAQAPEPEEPLQLLDLELQLACCGDWTHAGKVEGAFLSAMNLASSLRPLLA